MFHRPDDIDRDREMWAAAQGIDLDAGSQSWEFTAAAGDGRRPRLYVHGIIGGWRMDATKFVKAVHDLPATEMVDLHINSPGGYVHDAVSMFEALDAHPAGVDVHIGGLAASAASFLAMVGQTIKISRAGRVMIHDARTFAYGDPAELRRVADQGDAVSDDIAAIYADRAGGTIAEWRARMTATTWYSAREAVAAKLADQITGPARRGDTSRASQLVRARARVALGRGV